MILDFSFFTSGMHVNVSGGVFFTPMGFPYPPFNALPLPHKIASSAPMGALLATNDIPAGSASALATHQPAGLHSVILPYHIGKQLLGTQRSIEQKGL